MLPGLPVALWRNEVEGAFSLESLKADGHAVAYRLTWAGADRTSVRSAHSPAIGLRLDWHPSLSGVYEWVTRKKELRAGWTIRRAALERDRV